MRLLCWLFEAHEGDYPPVRGIKPPRGVDCKQDRLEVPGQCPRYEGEVYWDMRVQKLHVPSGIHALSLAPLYHITDYCNSFVAGCKESLPGWIGDTPHGLKPDGFLG